MHRLFNIMFFIFLVLRLPLQASANNLQLSAPQVVDSFTLSLHISWENSWKVEGVEEPFNHDAVWLFLKCLKPGQEWQHINISATAQHQSDNPLLGITVPNDEKGLFLKRAAPGSGDISATITIKLSAPVTMPADIRFFGIEMVHIPESSFWVGDGVSNHTLSRGSDTQPLQITSEQLIQYGTGAAMIGGGGDYPPAADVPAAFLKGFSGFYSMKYEITQQQYADFINTLDYQQQVERTTAQPESPSGTLAMPVGSDRRNGITIKIPAKPGIHPAVYACDGNGNGIFNESDDGLWRACNFLSWSDVAAYLDWAALRPMTELEFEKINRGNAQPVPQEFTWGTAEVTDANTIVADGTEWEAAADVLTGTSGIASHGYSGPQGPLRNGFAATSSATRLSAGASYYGVMEMSGNLWEQVINLSASGLTFTGTHGDGALSATGDADEAGWFGATGEGSGLRGGGWNSGIIPGFRDLAISDRFYIFQTNSSRLGTAGGRGVRTSP